jgi:hypothetical protein
VRQPMGPSLVGALSVLCSAVVGILTNVVTQAWSWTIAAALAAVIVAAVVLAWRDRSLNARGGTRASQIARGGSRISNTTIRASGNAAVDQLATDQGVIEDARLSAKAGDISQSADNSTISKTDISTQE